MQLLATWDSYPGCLVPGVVSLFGLVPLGGLLLGHLVGRGFDGYVVGVYVGTGIAVLWYTVETYYLRHETASHNAIAIQPVLVTDIGYHKVPNGTVTGIETMFLRNIGQGPALYVLIDDIVVDAATGLFARCETANVLRAGEEVEVSVETCVEQNGQITKHGSFLASLKRAPVGQQDYDVTIRSQDLGTRQHISVMRMGKSGVSLVSHD